ncbi:prephenate dehydratase [Cytobacillus sp. Hm23]|uniref:prephenate dehydratase n=1 Tax=Cytobacillus sp. IB215665 TaxID=3097357 RepID=UPI002A0FA73F|nr:prephenate dehydratase [Cytobacillus sp. IB215665]MDX8364066.1 prephenate dehydratase [Cytobacillus sp. IB215665]
MSIGYLGPKASFTDLAVSKLFSPVERIPFHTIPECIDAVSHGDVELSVVPLENALEGSVNLTVDYLIHEQTVPIVGEIVAPIKQHLMVHPDHQQEWQAVERVFSHSHAIAQCHKFLHKHLKGVTHDYTTSTSAAAKYVRENKSEKVAAIANELAALEYGLSIVRENIHDYQNNHTRFVVLHKGNKQLHTSKKVSGYKTTLMISLPLDDQSGALHQVLSAFAWRKLNLSKIESRPMKTGLGNYFFLIDIEKEMDDVLIPGAIAELEALGCSVNILGSYPYFHI